MTKVDSLQINTSTLPPLVPKVKSEVRGDVIIFKIVLEPGSLVSRKFFIESVRHQISGEMAGLDLKDKKLTLHVQTPDKEIQEIDEDEISSLDRAVREAFEEAKQALESCGTESQDSQNTLPSPFKEKTVLPFDPKDLETKRSFSGSVQKLIEQLRTAKGRLLESIQKRDFEKQVEKTVRAHDKKHEDRQERTQLQASHTFVDPLVIK